MSLKIAELFLFYDTDATTRTCNVKKFQNQSTGPVAIRNIICRFHNTCKFFMKDNSSNNLVALQQ